VTARRVITILITSSFHFCESNIYIYTNLLLQISPANRFPFARPSTYLSTLPLSLSTNTSTIHTMSAGKQSQVLDLPIHDVLQQIANCMRNDAPDLRMKVA
jgi:hypothetical protein